MHIAITHLRHAHSGGTERYCNDLARSLAERGHQITIVCRTHEEAPHPAVEFVQLRQWALGRGHRLQRFAHAVADHVASSHYDVVYGLGRTWSQDIIRLGGGTWALYLERSGQADRPRWQRALGRDQLSDRITLGIERRALGPVAQGGTPVVVCNSQLIADEVHARYHTERERLRVIHNAVDCERFDRERYRDQAALLRREWGCSDDDLVLLYLGSNYRRKGLERVFDAMAARNVPGLKLVVIGYDQHIDRWCSAAQQRGLDKQVVFAGGRRDAPICYAAADCYVLPSRYDPFANTTLEALASGLPVMTTDGNGGCEIIDGTCGSVVPWQAHGSDEELRNAFTHWLNRDRINSARAACRQRALANQLSVGVERSIAAIEHAAALRKATA